MKNFNKFLTATLGVCLLTTGLAFSQVPAEQEIIIIEPGTATLETTINEDVNESGVRINPNRVYQLKAGGVYVMSSRILFGGDTDTTSTLTIVGEKGGVKPIVLMNPLDNGNAFTNEVHGSLTLKNVYWPATAYNNTGAVLFSIFRNNQTLRLEDVVIEAAISGDLFNMKNSHGKSSIFIKNCYFRDINKFANPWNYAIYNKTMGDAIDTLWIENTTVANGGLAFLGKSCPTNVAIVNHNTIINIPKYAFINEQYKEAYFTNNIFINCNWQGEDLNMQLGQLQSQIDFGPHNAGVINVMEILPSWWEGYGTAPTNDELKILISNNLHFTSPFLNTYYESNPGSNIDWGKLPAGTTFPHPVMNIPPVFLNSVTQSLIDTYAGVKESDNHVSVDPLMNTKGIADQTVADEYIKWARKNYGTAEAGVSVDPLKIAFGDMDPTTIPGIETEDGQGITKIADFIEDFSYTADITSTIDFRPLGSLIWWDGGLNGWNSRQEFDKILHYYNTGEGTPLGIGIKDYKQMNDAFFTIYPNPAKDILNLDSKSELSSALVYDATGRIVKQLELSGLFNSVLDISSLNHGIYLLKVESVNGAASVSRFIKN